MHGEESLLQDIGLSIIFATVLSHIARVLKQPLILGYIIGGAMLGKEMGFELVTNEASIELISEIGLILLLFIIGLEINQDFKPDGTVATVFRPQMRLQFTDHVLAGIVTGIPANLRAEGLSTFLRLIYELP